MVTKLSGIKLDHSNSFILAKELMVTKHNYFDFDDYAKFYSSERIDGNETGLWYLTVILVFYSSERIDGNETSFSNSISFSKFYSSERIDGNETVYFVNF